MFEILLYQTYDLKKKPKISNLVRTTRFWNKLSSCTLKSKRLIEMYIADRKLNISNKKQKQKHTCNKICLQVIRN